VVDYYAYLAIIPVDGGHTYQVAASFQPAVSTRPVLIIFEPKDAASRSLGQQYSPTVTESAGAWVQAAATLDVGPEAVCVQLYVYVSQVQPGEVHYVDAITLVDVTPPEPAPIAPGCPRRAWLVMGERTLPLEDDLAGYACTELDLGGMGEVRDVTSNNPAADGITDRTLYMGARAMSADIRAYGGTMSPDEIGACFAPFMVPSARPELHYVLDRAGAPERFAVVRGAAYTWPVSGKRNRDIHLSWIAADPIVRDPLQKSAVAMAGSSTIAGRGYALTHNRIYPVGGGAASSAEIRSAGDVVVRPLLRLWGPITNPLITLTPTTGSDPAGPPAKIAFIAGYLVGAGHYVDVDTAAKTAWLDGDPSQSVMAQVDWAQSVWPILPTLPYYSTLTVAGESTSAASQVQALWYDGFLT
jgi:hypothetical protein